MAAFWGVNFPVLSILPLCHFHSHSLSLFAVFMLFVIITVTVKAATDKVSMQKYTYINALDHEAKTCI